MPDPGWAARTPEANDLLLKAGTGVGTHLANQTAWTTLGASHLGCRVGDQHRRHRGELVGCRVGGLGA